MINKAHIKIGDVVYGSSDSVDIMYDENTNVYDKITELSNKHDNIQIQVNECFQSVSNGKSLMASAITDMGVETDSDATFETMANNIGNIETGVDTSDANATAAQILSGASAYVDGVKLNGTMTNNGAKTASLNCGGSYTIPAGYHNGSGKVTANSLSSQTSATAAAANITKGKTAWVNGVKVTGTRPAPVTKLTGTFDLWIPTTNCVTTKIIEFKTPFDKVPKVSVNITKTGNLTDTSDWKINAVTRTNFTFSTRGNNWKYVTISVKWVAEA